MKIIISPAKSFKHFDNIETEELLFPEKTKVLVDRIKKLSLNEIGNLNMTNDKLTEKAYSDYQDFDFENLPNPALFSYDGLVFKQFDMEDFDDIGYLNDHVYILSALYGLLKPMTGIRDYRLYFDNSMYDLYEFWADDIYKKLYKDDDLIINLASKEYTKTIRPFLKDTDKFLTIDFKEVRDGKLKSVVAYMKQARGAMLREIITRKIEDVDEIKKLDINGYVYDPYNSKRDTLTFVRDGDK
ncbi:peroxide stress protein YaaA [uncultured Anaerococcus sp.]|uniref:peroxide stress protein YaaA n=1 Tax=uncultured Anaerococcus sp. TaxID=293428 RepID=UPI0025D1663A|nr:peroxide stress protein YaaA [uncultured Anaerococcus sp.]